MDEKEMLQVHVRFPQNGQSCVYRKELLEQEQAIWVDDLPEKVGAIMWKHKTLEQLDER